MLRRPTAYINWTAPGDCFRALELYRYGHDLSRKMHIQIIRLKSEKEKRVYACVCVWGGGYF